jgi:hypothetical protein
MHEASKELRKQSPIFEDYLAQCVETYRMLNIVEKIQSSITLSLVSGMFESQSIEVAVRVLDIFN